MRGKRSTPIAKDVKSEAKAGGRSPLGPVSASDDMPIEGSTVRRRFDRPGRKLGGRVGADSAPLSTANKNTGGRSC